MGSYVELQKAERRNQDKESRSTHEIAGTKAHESLNGFSAVLRTSPVEWHAWRRLGQRVVHGRADPGSPGFSVSRQEDELLRGFACGLNSGGIPERPEPRRVSSIPPRNSSGDAERWAGCNRTLPGSGQLRLLTLRRLLRWCDRLYVPTFPHSTGETVNIKCDKRFAKGLDRFMLGKFPRTFERTNTMQRRPEYSC